MATRGRSCLGCCAGCLVLFLALVVLAGVAVVFRDALPAPLRDAIESLRARALDVVARDQPLPGDPLRGARVLEQQSGTVTSAGGSVRLADGTSVVVPPGAVEGRSVITVRRLEPSRFRSGPGWVTAALDCSATASRFRKPVQVRLPLPAAAATADPADFLCGFLDPATGVRRMMPVRRETGPGGVELVLATDHFCGFVFEWMLGPEPPESAPALAVPIYKQGMTKFCWAASLQMISRAASDGGGSVYELIGGVGQPAEGVGNLDLRFNGAIDAVLAGRCGVPSVRDYWDFGVLTAGGSEPTARTLHRYLKKILGVGRLPVMIGSSWRGHAYVLLGYDAEGNYIVHDPRQPPDYARGIGQAGHAGYFKVSEQMLGINWFLPGNSCTTVWVPRLLAERPPSVSLSIPDGGLTVARRVPETDATPVSFAPGKAFRWDHRTPSGHSWAAVSAEKDSADYCWLRSGEPENPYDPSGVEIINGAPEGGAMRQVEVALSIRRDGHTGPVVFEQEWSVAAAANRSTRVPFSVDTSRFHDGARAGGSTYAGLLQLREGSAVLDEARFFLPLAGKEPAKPAAAAKALWYLAQAEHLVREEQAASRIQMTSSEGRLTALMAPDGPEPEYKYRIGLTWTPPPATLTPGETLTLTASVDRTWIIETRAVNRRNLDAGFVSVSMPGKHETVRNGQARITWPIRHGEPGERLLVEIDAVPANYFWPHLASRYLYVYGGKDLPEPRLPVGTNPLANAR